MEIISIFTQRSGDELLLLIVQGAATLSGMLIALHLMAGLLRRIPALPVRVRSVVPPALSMGALATLALATPALASPVGTDLHPGSVQQASPALDEWVPSPRSLVRAGVIPPPSGLMRASVHPAIHRGDEAVGPDGPASSPGPLFPRPIKSRTTSTQLHPWERGVIDLRRAGRTKESRKLATGGSTDLELTHYAVLPGDTLWDIAAKVLKTDDQRAIARYWPRIHRENRDVIGRNPDLIRPGQVFSLPRKEQA